MFFICLVNIYYVILQHQKITTMAENKKLGRKPLAYETEMLRVTVPKALINKCRIEIARIYQEWQIEQTNKEIERLNNLENGKA